MTCTLVTHTYCRTEFLTPTLLTCRKLEVWAFHFSSGLPCQVFSTLKQTCTTIVIGRSIHQIQLHHQITLSKLGMCSFSTEMASEPAQKHFFVEEKWSSRSRY